jgi:uncharacterized ion transporter superfamily protein YfcC
MAEESLPFYTLLVPVMMAARFDPVVAAATVLLGPVSVPWAPPSTRSPP